MQTISVHLEKQRKTNEAALSLLIPGIATTSKKTPASSLRMTESEMARYVGTYQNRWDMDIFIREKSLYLRRFGDELPITKIGENRFSVYPPGAAIPQEFLLIPGNDGKAEYIQMFLWIFKRI